MEELNQGHDTTSREEKTGSKLNGRGRIALGICGAAFVGIYAVTGPFITPALRRICLPYVPATTKQIDNVFGALVGRQGSSTLLDIGSGDGRIVIEASKRGYRADGVELNVWLVLYSKYQAWKHRLTSANFYRKDLWKVQLAGYDNIVVFGVEKMMDPLEKKFARELSPHCQVVACRFPLPNWEPVLTVGTGVDTVWLYTVPVTNSAASTSS
ncbi:hypothetical protein ScPMuIL_012483 [Solemya velum]